MTERTIALTYIKALKDRWLFFTAPGKKYLNVSVIQRFYKNRMRIAPAVEKGSWYDQQCLRQLLLSTIFKIKRPEKFDPLREKISRDIECISLIPVPLRLKN